MSRAREHLARVAAILSDPLYEPNFTCDEADAIFAAIAYIDEQMAQRFAAAHAATDDEAERVGRHPLPGEGRR